MIDNLKLGKRKMIVAVLLLSALFFISMALVLKPSEILRARAEDETACALNIMGAQVKADNTYYDVSFSYSGPGYFSNDLAEAGNITMEYTSVSLSRASVSGEVYGLVRASAKNDVNYLYSSTGTNTLLYSYNGGDGTYTPAGKDGRIVYDVSASKGTYNNLTDGGDGISPSTTAYSVGKTFKQADEAGAKYLGVQWVGGTYTASLTKMKVFDTQGWDLGIYIPKGNHHISSSKQLMGMCGEIITVRPNIVTERDIVGLSFKNSSNQVIAGSDLNNLNVTDNGDGTYSFTMPQYAVKVEPSLAAAYELEVVNGRIDLINGIYYDVSFDFNGTGYFCNDLPTVGNIIMEYSALSASRDSKNGEIFGMVRSSSKNDINCLYASTGTNTLLFTYNGGDGTYTPAGKDGKIIYSTSTHIGTYYNLTDNSNGISPLHNAYSNGKTFEQADISGAKYLGVQWYGGVYSATLTNVKIYDADGRDLGIYLPSNPALISSSIKRYGIEGQLITVRPDVKAGKYVSTLLFEDAGGETVAINTINNYDGTFSFEMPEEKISVKPVYNDSLSAFVTFNAANGTANTVIELKTGESVEKPLTPLKEGYVFAGWYQDGNSESYNFNAPITESLTLSAHWLEKVSDTSAYCGLYIDSFGKSISLFDDGKIYSKDLFDDRTTYGIGLVAGQLQICIDAEPIFVMINVSDNTLLYNGNTFTKYNGTLYRVDYHTNTYALEVFHRYTTDGVIENLAYTSPHYIFFGWLTESGEPFDFAGTTISEDTTLYADLDFDDGLTEYELYYAVYYNSSNNCLISLKPNNAAEEITASGKKDVTYYIFTDGTLWIIDNGNYSFYTVGYTFLNSGTLKYLRLMTYFVTFEVNGGDEPIERKTVNGGNYRVEMPTEPIREGFEFVGWAYIDGTLFDFDTVITESITLYALWNAETSGNGKTGCGSVSLWSGGGTTGILLFMFLSCVVLLLHRRAEKKEI